MFPESTGLDYGRSLTDDCRVAAPLAARLRDSRASLSLRWLERIAARVSIDEEDVFPTGELLDHVPLLINAIADYLERPAEEGPRADQVLLKAAELGRMRFEQGFSPYQILKEFELLGGILLSYLSRAADELPIECPPGEFLICAQRIHRALSLIQQATAARYLALLETQASEREQRLRALNDILSGSLRQRVDEAVATASAMEDEGQNVALRSKLERVAAGLEQLQLLSNVTGSARMQRNVPLEAAVAEAVRTLRDSAAARGIPVRVPEPLPALEVNAAAVELALLVFLTAFIRHCETVSPERVIEIRGVGSGDGDDSVIQLSVRDVGGRLSPDVRRAMEEPGTGTVADPVASADPDAPSPAVSLEIAREAIEALGGRVTLLPEGDGTSSEFVLDLPSRRSEDRAQPSS